MTTSLHQQHGDLSNIKENLKHTNAKALPEMQKKVINMAEKLDFLPEMSKTQHGQVIALLEGLQSQIASLNMGVSKSEEVRNEMSCNHQKLEASQMNRFDQEENELAHSLKKLHGLATLQGGSGYSEETDIIIDALTTLFSSMVSVMSISTASSTSQVNLKQPSEAITRREIQQLAGLVESASLIQWNMKRESSSLC
jgi:hypothetical protein